MATKEEVLQYFAKTQIVTTFNLMMAFNISHSGALMRLMRMKRERLIESEISPDRKTKNWWLTEVGWDRLFYYAKRRVRGND